MGIANSILLDGLTAKLGAFSPSATTPFEGSEWEAQKDMSMANHGSGPFEQCPSAAVAFSERLGRSVSVRG